MSDDASRDNDALWYWHVDFPGLTAEQATQLAELAREELELSGASKGILVDPDDWCAMFMDRDTVEMILSGLLVAKQAGNVDLDGIIEDFGGWLSRKK